MQSTVTHLPFFNTFRAYARNHTGELWEPGRACQACQAQMIHMSRYDARLRLQDDACNYAPGRLLELRVSDKLGRTAALSARAAVLWVHDNELGLFFPDPLDVGAHELQSLLD